MRTIQKRLLVSLTALLALSMGASAQKGSDSREAIDSVIAGQRHRPERAVVSAEGDYREGITRAAA